MINFRLLFVFLTFLGFLNACDKKDPVVVMPPVVTPPSTNTGKISALDSHDFGVIQVGTTKPFQWVLENKSDKAATLGAIPAFNSPVFRINNAQACTNMAPASKCILNVLFTPTTPAEASSESIKITYMIDGKTEMLNLKLTGKAQAKDVIRNTGKDELTGPKSLGFLGKVGDTKEVPLSILNPSATLAATTLKLNITGPNFCTVSDPEMCETKGIAPGGKCKLNVKCTPSTPGPFQGKLVIEYTLSNNKSGMLEIKLAGNAKAAGAFADAKTELFDILENRPVDFYLSPLWKTPINYQGHKFGVDNDGKFYTDVAGTKIDLNVTSTPSGPGQYFIIPNPPAAAKLGHGGNYNINWGTQEEKNMFSYLVQRQRGYGIFSIKNKYPDCYFSYATKRLNLVDPAPKLLDMERDADPIPLVFKDQAQWDDFKADIKNLFKHFKSPDSYIAIIGTATTFFSVNPTKGENSAFFKTKMPTCQGENNPDVYTFDTPGAPSSDVDINILIPEISGLCHKYGEKALGNQGDRVAYWENWLHVCLAQSNNNKVKEIFSLHAVNFQDKMRGHIKPGSDFDKFFKKWNNLLRDANGQAREINFSVRILPAHLSEPFKETDTDFNNDPVIKNDRFIIPIN